MVVVTERVQEIPNGQQVGVGDRQGYYMFAIMVHCAKCLAGSDARGKVPGAPTPFRSQRAQQCSPLRLALLIREAHHPAHALGLALPEHETGPRGQVFGVLQEAEAHGGSVPRPQPVPVHAHDLGRLAHRLAVDDGLWEGAQGCRVGGWRERQAGFCSRMHQGTSSLLSCRGGCGKTGPSARNRPELSPLGASGPPFFMHPRSHLVPGLDGGGVREHGDLGLKLPAGAAVQAGVRQDHAPPHAAALDLLQCQGSGLACHHLLLLEREVGGASGGGGVEGRGSSGTMQMRQEC